MLYNIGTMNKNKLWQLFYTTFIISASTSGGYAIISVMKDKFVNKNKWLLEDEMMDLLAIAQSTPGPIAINTSILVGYRISGLSGAFITLLGTTLPPLIIMSIVSSGYSLIADNVIVGRILKGMQAGVVAMLVNVTIDLFINLTKQKSILSYLIFVLAFLIVEFTNVSIAYIALGCIVAGVIKVLLMKKVEDKE